MCKHMSDAGGCKDEDAGAAQNQFLNRVRYVIGYDKDFFKFQEDSVTLYVKR
ncbi:MAG TPA: hypothetical protein VLG49_03105 [Rhabdochlamydiaceae bacterium]|nr:hypothetical protein [Rhabdochlamydiaceae bacterium]